MIKNNKLLAVIYVVSLIVSPTVLADVADDLVSEFASLEKSSETSGNDWFDLAVKAREAGSPDVATQAINKAAETAFSPIRVEIERARQAAASGDRDTAVTTLRGVFEQGFTVVSVLVNDPVLNGLAGYLPYDTLIDEMSVQAYPCEHQPGFSDFDFWVGDWDVHLANGTPAGRNSISREERSCVLVERWQSATGGTGMSINYMDMTSSEWVQIWNAAGGTQINIRGGLTGEGMAMQGTIHYVAGGTTAPFRALWTPLDDGRVRQYFEQSNDGGETWVPWFEGFYTRSTD